MDKKYLQINFVNKMNFIFLLLLSFPLISWGCFNPTNVTGNSAIIHLDLKNHPALFPYSRWDIEVRTGEGKLYSQISSTSLPLSVYMTNLKEWTEYKMKVTYVQIFWVHETKYDYSQTILCQGSFITIPRIIKMDAVDNHRYIDKELLLGTAQIWNPQNFKFRFEWGPYNSYEYTHSTHFKDLQGVGVALDTATFNIFPPIRVRLVVKSKIDSVIPEIYVSEPMTAFDKFS